MIKSMTGFGRAEYSEGSVRITIELKSVNHRYLDLNIRLPRRLNYLEALVRNTVKSFVSRGKIDLFISYENTENAALGLRYNKEVAETYMKYLRQMEEDFDLRSELSSVSLARMPEVISMEEVNEDHDQLWKLMEPVLKTALEHFNGSRAAEGEALRNDLIDKLAVMSDNVKLVEERYPEILAEHEQRIREKLKEITEDSTIDESRIAAEMVIFADRLCTDEEVVRLANHVNTMKKLLTEGGEKGKQLDFIAQEMNREANTILSKSNDMRTSDVGIALKTDIEKIREQIQNIE